MVAICTFTILIYNATFAQDSSIPGDSIIASNQNQIIISKIATGNTIIANKTVSVGGFDTDYSIIGTGNRIKYSKDLIISSIIDDFAKSSNVGYVMISKSYSNSSESQIANPFASNEQINQTIQDLLDKSIEDVASSKSGLIEIRCSFGDSLDLFTCTSNALLD